MFRNILHSVFTKGAVAAINFLILLISARYLGADSRGEINILVVNIAIIQILNEVYTGYSLIYFIPKFDLKKIFFTGLFFTLTACTLGNSIFYTLNKLIPDYEILSAVISLVVILNTFNCVIILGKQNIVLYNFLCLLQPLLLLIGMMVGIFVLSDYTIHSYLYPMLGSFLAVFPISLFSVLRSAFTEPSEQNFEIKPILRYGIICQLGVLMYLLSNKYSYYLLPGNKEVGLYGTASSLIESVLIIANGISPVLLAKVVNSEKSERHAEITLLLSKASLLLSLIAVLILFILPSTIFIFLLGDGFSEIKTYMLWYAPGILIMSFISIINNYFSAVGKLEKVLVSNLFGFILTLFLAPYFVSTYGIKGAALTADLSYGVTAIVIGFIFFKSNKFQFRDLGFSASDIKGLKQLVNSKG